jgi:hypothetical protein
MPPSHQAINNIRIRCCECFCRRGRLSLKQEYRPVNRVGQRPAQEQLATAAGSLGMREVCRPECRSALLVVCNDFVEEQVVHGRYSLKTHRAHGCCFRAIIAASAAIF